MSSDSVDPSSPSPTFFSLPLELRQQIYTHALPSLIILPSIPSPTRLPSKGPGSFRNLPLSSSNTYLDPTPTNPLVYGIANLHSRWRVPTQAYPPAARSRVMTTKYRAEPAPHPLQLTCRQLCAEVTRFALTSGIWKFGFASFEAMIKFLRGRGSVGERDRFGVAREVWIGWIGSVMVEVELDVVPSAKVRRLDLGNGATVSLMREASEQSADSVEARDGSEDEEDTVLESQEPWFDALCLLTRMCPRIHALGLRVELKGPEVQVIHFGETPTRTSSSTNQGTGPVTAAPASQDWPPGHKQPRADFHPTIERLLESVESLKVLRTCGLTIRAGHTLRNLAADPGDGSCWARSWEEADLGKELEDRIEGIERGLDGVCGELYGKQVGRSGLEAAGAVTDVGEARRRRLAERGREQYWY